MPTPASIRPRCASGGTRRHGRSSGWRRSIASSEDVPRPAVAARRRCATGAIVAALAIALVSAAYFRWVGQQEPRWVTSEPTGHHIPEYARSLLRGHPWVREAPPQMAALPDPWDPEQYRPWFAFDLSYYDGRFHSYFGPTPALTLFAPWLALTGTHLTEPFAAGLYLSLGFAGALALLAAVRRRHLRRAPAWSLVLSGAVLAWGNLGVLLLLPPHYGQVVQASAWWWLVAALGAAFLALDPARGPGRWLAASSLACGLMVASRASHLAATPLLLPPLLAAIAASSARDTRRSRARPSGARLVAATLLPLGAIVAGLLWFNQVRFGSPFEFGLRYQQFGADRRHQDLFALSWLPGHVAAHLFAVPPIGGEFPFLPNQQESIGALALLPFHWLALLVPIGWLAQAGEERRRFGAIAAAAAIATAGILVAVASFYLVWARHEVDFALPLSWLASLGLVSAAHAWAGRPFARRALALAAGVLAVLSIVVTLCFALADWNHPEVPWLEHLLGALVGPLLSPRDS